jgi:Cys-tRNA(Pro) deacylase
MMDEGRKLVEDFFKDRGMEKRILDYGETTHDSFHAAKAIGVEIGQIAKSILFIADGKPVLVIISGDERVDMKALKKSLGAKKLKFAGEKDVTEHTGFGVGAVSPVGLPSEVRIFLDRSLKKFEKIYPAAGGTNTMFESTFEELKDLTGAIEADLSTKV